MTNVLNDLYTGLSVIREIKIRQVERKPSVVYVYSRVFILFPLMRSYYLYVNLKLHFCLSLLFLMIYILKSNIIYEFFTSCRRITGRMRISVQMHFQIFHHVAYLTVSVQCCARVVQITNSLKIRFKYNMKKSLYKIQ